MNQIETTATEPILCADCGQVTPGYEIVNYGSMESGYRKLCSRCFNAMVAKLAGLEAFENARLEPVGIADSTGEIHQFHFRTHLFGTRYRLGCVRATRRRTGWLPVSDHRRARG